MKSFLSIALVLWSAAATAKTFEGYYSCDETEQTGLQTMAILNRTVYYNGRKAARSHGYNMWNGSYTVMHPSHYDGIVFLDVIGFDGRAVYAKCTRYALPGR